MPSFISMKLVQSSHLTKLMTGTTANHQKPSPVGCEPGIVLFRLHRCSMKHEIRPPVLSTAASDSLWQEPRNDCGTSSFDRSSAAVGIAAGFPSGCCGT